MLFVSVSLLLVLHFSPKRNGRGMKTLDITNKENQRKKIQNQSQFENKSAPVLFL